jgi:hypothetical protein
MKNVIILKSHGDRVFFAMLDAKTSHILLWVPLHLLPYEDYIVRIQRKDQRDECEYIKGILNLPFLGLILLSLRSLAHKM